MITAQDLIARRLVSLIAPAVPDTRVDIDVDFEAMRPDEAQAVEVQIVISSVQSRFAGTNAPVVWRSFARVSCGARGDKADPTTGRKSSLLLAAAHAAICTDATLGGLLDEPLLIQEMRPDAERSSTAIGVLAAVYACEHQTPWNTLTT